MILVKADWLITQDPNRRIIKNGAVLIEREQIADIGKVPKLEKKYAKAKIKIINGKGKVVIPGLINSHTHAAMTLLRGYADDLPLNEWLTQKIWPAETKFTAADIFCGTKLACEEMLASGTTAFNNMYYHPEQEIKAARQNGIRDFVGLVAIQTGSQKCGPAYIESEYRKLKNLVSEKIKLVLAPHAIYTVPKETLIWCKKFADKNGLLLHIHLSETEGEIKNCLKQNKCRPAEHLEKIGFLGKNVLVAHGCWLSETEIRILAKRGVSIAHCPTSNLKLASGVMPLSKLLKAGVNVCLGTDGASSNNSLDMFSEMKTAALIHKWNERNPSAAPAQTIFDLVTLNGAKALGRQNELGSLEIGKKADIAILNFNQPHLKPCFNPISHLIYAACGRDVEMVLVGGKIMHQANLKFAYC